jgi:hypothetical protein
VEDYFNEFTTLGKDNANKKEIAKEWRQAIIRRVVYLWTALYNLIFSPNIPQKHIKIDNEERQFSD